MDYQNLEIRADRYIARKDTLLLRAIVRIWRARMRGVKLQRFKEITTLQNAWQKWSYRLSKERAQTGVFFSYSIVDMG
jgi:protein SFI1